MAVATQHVKGKDDDPDLGAEVDDENEGSSTDEEEEGEEVGTYQHDGHTLEEAFMDKIRLSEEFTVSRRHQRAQDSCGLQRHVWTRKRG